MAISNLQLNEFKDTFTGNIHNYGQHTYAFTDKGEKEKGGNKAIIDKLLTITQYKAHLNGKIGLGIVPVNENGECKFAVIDVDVYNQNFEPYLDAIERYNFPLVPFYSKSGGLHIYTFFRQFTKTKAVIKRLQQIARIIGISLFVREYKKEAVEIFPKQIIINPGAKNFGSWINLPYYNAEDTRQGAIKHGKVLDFKDAMLHIKNKQTSIEEIDMLLNDLPYADGPPCLQTLNLLNMLGKDSGRNNYLFSFGVYLKKKDENYFEQTVMEINNNLATPLTGEEVENTLLSSLRKKDYTYKCTVSPCLDFCDKKVCAVREYGIGKEQGYFTNLIFGKFMQYQAATPYYEWEVKGQDIDTFKVLRFKSEDEVIKQDTFLRLCFRELHFLPFKMKQVEWFKLVNQALNEMKLVEISKEDDTSPLVRFHNLFYDFLTARAKATTKDQIVNKRVYYDDVKDKYYFRTKDLVEYLYDFKSFRLYSSGEIHGLLRDIGINSKVLRTETGKQVRVVEILGDKVSEEYLASKEDYKIDFSQYQEEEQF